MWQESFIPASSGRGMSWRIFASWERWYTGTEHRERTSKNYYSKMKWNETNRAGGAHMKFWFNYSSVNTHLLSWNQEFQMLSVDVPLGVVYLMITFKFSLICKHFQNLQDSVSCSGRRQMAEGERTKLTASL